MLEKGNQTSSKDNTLGRIRQWFDTGQPIATLSPTQVRQAYEARRKKVSVDTHRNELAEVKTFLRWAYRRGMVQKPLIDVLEKIEGMGKRHKGKAQLREREAQLLDELSLSAARCGEEIGLAVAMLLHLGLRAMELLERVVRDVDVTLSRLILWVPDSKTEAGRRRLEVAEPLASLLAERIRGQQPGAFLFPAQSRSGHREKTWLLRRLAGLCRDAGVPVICVHGLRGTHATLAEEAGMSAAAVIRQLGHTSHRVTADHYLEPGTGDRVKGRAVLKVLQGGGR